MTRQNTVQDARTFVVHAHVATFGETTSHLHTDIEHRLGDLDVLALQEALGIGGELQGHQRLLLVRATQHNAPVRQLDNFQK